MLPIYTNTNVTTYYLSSIYSSVYTNSYTEIISSPDMIKSIIINTNDILTPILTLKTVTIACYSILLNTLMSHFSKLIQN